jgi:putative (di)nucleoside polyphosphate hydrolase
MPRRLTPEQIAELPYRPCVGVALINGEGRLFAAQRIDNPEPAWQMPQGGVDRGEDLLDAALRELEEETSIRAAKVSLLREHPGWIDYDLPPELAGKLWKGRYRGQTQKWFAFRFEGGDSDIDLETKHPEFRAWTWMPAGELIDKIVPFKRQTYQQVFEAFDDLLV